MWCDGMLAGDGEGTRNNIGVSHTHTLTRCSNYCYWFCYNQFCEDCCRTTCSWMLDCKILVMRRPGLGHSGFGSNGIVVMVFKRLFRQWLYHIIACSLLRVENGHIYSRDNWIVNTSVTYTTGISTSTYNIMFPFVMQDVLHDASVFHGNNNAIPLVLAGYHKYAYAYDT